MKLSVTSAIGPIAGDERKMSLYEPVHNPNDRFDAARKVALMKQGGGQQVLYVYRRHLATAGIGYDDLLGQRFFARLNRISEEFASSGESLFLGSLVVSEVRPFIINGFVIIAQMEKISGHGNTLPLQTVGLSEQCRCKFRTWGILMERRRN